MRDGPPQMESAADPLFTNQLSQEKCRTGGAPDTVIIQEVRTAFLSSSGLCFITEDMCDWCPTSSPSSLLLQSAVKPSPHSWPTEAHPHRLGFLVDQKGCP
ncbi:hypothetical protein E2C01_062546 [Portunus trituberculatus]|uniref:Uncharacterized protein n=1 Tax=Portunus trituberculatus TaxID=210409 RepID=A0A5B7HEB9_PORTR|nr:hypothetical protein [Portunus trituberculatus]